MSSYPVVSAKSFMLNLVGYSEGNSCSTCSPLISWIIVVFRITWLQRYVDGIVISIWVPKKSSDLKWKNKTHNWIIITLDTRKVVESEIREQSYKRILIIKECRYIIHLWAISWLSIRYSWIIKQEYNCFQFDFTMIILDW